MSVIILKIKNKNDINTVKKILNVFSNDIAVMNDDEYRDANFAGLLKEGRKSRILSEQETKAEFKKRGVTF